jgi:hypothetical protein
MLSLSRSRAGTRTCFLISPLILACAAAAALLHVVALAETIAVRHSEGVVHGFLVLSSTDGTALADGDLEQTADGQRVTSRLVFRFRDTSVHDETAVFSQNRSFQLISDHLVQKGPSFPHPLDMTVTPGHVAARYTAGGREQVVEQRLDAPPDASNGLMLTLLKNLKASATPVKFSVLAATPRPRMVTLAVTSPGEETFTIGASTRKATHYIITVEIGGLSGLLAPVLGKQPPDTHVWVLGGDTPAFVKFEGPLYAGGPVWRMELASPVWPGARGSRTPRPRWSN